MEISKKTIISTIFSIILSTTLVNLGAIVISESIYIGLSTILIGFITVYFIYYSAQIKTNQKKIDELENWKENKEELLNTLKDIIILKRVSKIK